MCPFVVREKCHVCDITPHKCLFIALRMLLLSTHYIQYQRQWLVSV